MHIISKDEPALYITSVTKDRLPVFRTDELKTVACKALCEARESAGFSLYAYVVMLDHLHVITDSPRKPSDILRYINGIISRRVIDHLKEKRHESSLLKLRHDVGKRGYQYSLWDHHNNVFSITTEETLLQKVNYVHQNPVRAGLVETAEDYLWSSARWWAGRRPDEPIDVDIDKITWKRTGRIWRGKA